MMCIFRLRTLIFYSGLVLLFATINPSFAKQLEANRDLSQNSQIAIPGKSDWVDQGADSYWALCIDYYYHRNSTPLSGFHSLCDQVIHVRPVSVRSFWPIRIRAECLG